jgi:molecular chaperone GrpE
MSEQEIKINLTNDEGSGRPEEPQSTDAAREESQMKKLSADLADLQQTLLRRQADFDNYRKRVEKERAEDSKRATARVVESLIPIVDGFEHALAAHKEDEYAIYKQLLDNLARLGVERVEPLGRPFDPHMHQAMDRTETTEHDDGTILEVFQPAYVYNGRVLRPAMVRVAVHPGGASNKAVN